MPSFSLQKGPVIRLFENVLRFLLMTVQGELSRISKTKVTAWATAAGAWVAAELSPWLQSLGEGYEGLFGPETLIPVFVSLISFALVALRDGVDRGLNKVD